MKQMLRPRFLLPVAALLCLVAHWAFRETPAGAEPNPAVSRGQPCRPSTPTLPSLASDPAVAPASLPEAYLPAATDLQGRVRRTVYPAPGKSAKETLAALRSLGGVALGWNPKGGYDASLTPRAADALTRQGFRAGPSPLPVSRALRAALAREGRVEAVFVCAGVAEAEALKARLGGGLVVGDALLATAPSAAVAQALAEGAGILAADLRRPAELCNNVARGERFLGAEALQLNATWLTGEGETVAVFDTGLSTGIEGFGKEGGFHPGLRSRVLRMSPQPWAVLSGLTMAFDATCYDSNGHGTHVVGSAVGDGGGSEGGRFRGVAPGARLFFQNNGTVGSAVALPPTLDPVLREAYDAGARVHSNSWGDTPNNNGRAVAEAYDLDSWVLDRFVWERPDFLPVFAAGNSGTDLDADGVADFGTLISGPALAKNVLAVGAAESFRLPGNADGVPMNTYASGFEGAPVGARLADDPRSYAPGGEPDVRGLAAFSCRGPLPDGRVKPDVVAPGTRIVSARGPTVGARYELSEAEGNTAGERANYSFNDGTSMATPITSGACAVVRQWCREALGVREPSSALVRAVLLSGCRSLFPGQFGDGPDREIPSAAPNGAEGFGLISLARALTPESGLPTAETFPCPETGVTLDFPVEVGAEGTLRAVLAWVDYPAQVYASSALVNDLDLMLLNARGEAVAFPNGLEAPDRVNVAERIEAEVAPGAYTLRVTAHRVPFPGGAAALVAQAPGGAKPFIAHAPVRRLAPGEAFAPEARLLWPAAKGDALALETSTDGATWRVAEGLNVAAPAVGPFFYRLTAPGAEPRGPYAVAVGEPVTLTVADEGVGLVATPAVGQCVPLAAGETVRATARETLAYAPEPMGALAHETHRARGWKLEAQGRLVALGEGAEALFAMPEGDATLTWLSAPPATERCVRVSLERFFGLTKAVWLPKGGTLTLPDIGPSNHAGDFVVPAWKDGAGKAHAPGSRVGPLFQDATFTAIPSFPGEREWATHWFGSEAFDRTADPDGDGYTNAEEQADLTAPTDPASRPEPPALTLLERAPVRSPAATWRPRLAAINAYDNRAVEALYVQTRLPGETAWRTATFDLPTDARVAPLGARTEYRIGVADALGKAFFEGTGGRPEHLVWGDVFTLECVAPEPRLEVRLQGSTLVLANRNGGIAGAQSLTVRVTPQTLRRATYDWPAEALGRVEGEESLRLALPWEELTPAHRFTVTVREYASWGYPQATLEGGGDRPSTPILGGGGSDTPITRAFAFEKVTRPTPFTHIAFTTGGWDEGDYLVLSALTLEDDAWQQGGGAPDAFDVTLAPGEERAIPLTFGVPPAKRRLLLESNDPLAPKQTLRWAQGYRLRLR